MNLTKKELEVYVEKGQEKFMLQEGLRFGCIFIVFMIIYSIFILGEKLDNNYLIVMLIIGGVFGLFAGYVGWNRIIKKYKELDKNE